MPTGRIWRARHRGLGVRRRLRLYHSLAAKGSETRDTLVRAAKREVLLLQGIDHPGIVKAFDYTEHELGPTVIFEHHAGTQRLDHWLAKRGERLSFDQRLHLLRHLVEILHFAHGRRLVHRGLSPQSVLVLDQEAWDDERLAALLDGLDELLPWLLQWHDDIDPAVGMGLGTYFKGFVAEERRRLAARAEAVDLCQPAT